MDPATLRFFQYVADDRTQLHSAVVRVFRETYDAEAAVDLARVAGGGVQFHAHVLLQIGIKQGFWRKVGHAPAPETVDVLFRGSNDSGNPRIKVSRDWYVWKINCPSERVGELVPRYQEAEIGYVVPPDSLVHRMRCGDYDFVHPGY